jgi:hypothetical protein
MKVYPSLKPGIWGAVIGAAAISVVGFSSLGWTLGGTAERMAQERSQTAVVAVLAPICVEKFTACDQPASLAARRVFGKAFGHDVGPRRTIGLGYWLHERSLTPFRLAPHHRPTAIDVR